jgi:hypothetical protein
MSDQPEQTAPASQSTIKALAALETLQKMADKLDCETIEVIACGIVVAFLKDIGQVDVAEAFEALVQTEE